MRTERASASRRWPTFPELVSEHAARMADKVAFTFLHQPDAPAVDMTYAELDRLARAIAAAIQAAGGAGERALVMFPASLDFITAFLGCLYSGAVAVPLHPPHAAPRPGHASRVEPVLRDSDPAIVLTHAALQPAIERLFAGEAADRRPRIIATDTVTGDAGGGWTRPRLAPTSLAFLQYTSGSTAAPKGVMITHANLLRNERDIAWKCGQSETSTILGWLPLFHDMGLIGNVLHSLYVGARAVLMPPAAFLESPRRWLDAIGQFKATASGGPNFAYELCVRRIRPEDREGLDLSTWTVAFNGAEPVRPDTLDRFAAAFGRYGFRREAFYPCYGLAEATLMVSGGQRTEPPTVRTIHARALQEKRAVTVPKGSDGARAVAGCGTPMPDHTVLVVDPDSRRPCGPGEVGEIWVKGPSVARGYWNNRAETRRVFGARLADGSRRGFLRTGDLGFVHDDELFVTGRLKDVLIIRGRNHHAEDVEQTVASSHPAIRFGAAAAFSIDDGCEERVVVAVELDRHAATDVSEIAGAIRDYVAAAHELLVHLVAVVRPGALPRTTSGKLQRSACRARFVANELGVIATHQAAAGREHAGAPGADAPADVNGVLEAKVIALCARAVRVAAAHLPADEPLVRLGMDSLAAIELCHALRAELGIEILPSAILGGWSAAEVLAAVSGSGAHPHAAALPSDEPPEAPASAGQGAIWFEQQLTPGSVAYNLARAFRLRPRVHVPTLRRALDDIVQRHAALRTSFALRDAEVIRQVHRAVEIEIEEVDARGSTGEDLRSMLSLRARRPFDLGVAPLVRAAVFRQRDDEDLLLVVTHHIVADLWSLPVFLNDLAAAYARHAGEPIRVPDPPPAAYSDYVRRQREYVASDAGWHAAEFWRRELADAPLRTALPVDATAATPTPHGGRIGFSLPADVAERLRVLARTEGITLCAVLLAAFAVLLRRYADDDDVVVGSPAMGRPSGEFDRVIGYFVNPVSIRARVARSMAFTALARQVHRTLTGALDHQLYPHALVTSALNRGGSPAPSAAFNVFFAFQGSGRHSAPLPAATVLGTDGRFARLGPFDAAPVAVELNAAQFDLSMFIAEDTASLEGTIEYRSDLFERATVEQLGRRFSEIVGWVAGCPGSTVVELDLPAEERTRVLRDCNATAATYEGPTGVHELVEAQVRRTPGVTALRCEGTSLTYDELNRRANRLAHLLRRHGIGAESVVGVCLERSVGMVAGLLGVLKAGAAYVPLDPEWPAQRLAAVVADAGVSVVLSAPGLDVRLPRTGIHVVLVDPASGAAAGEAGGEEQDPRSPVCDASLAYVIYTSGSTGRPKGVMNCHGPVRNRLLWMQDRYALSASDRVLQKTPFGFDVSVWEFFWPLMTGATLAIARPGGHRDPAYLQRVIEAEGITAVHFVPSMLEVFLTALPRGACASLARVFASGEALTADLCRRFYSTLGCELHNLYGPTEAAVDVTAWACSRSASDDPVPIGRPIANAAVYVLDRDLEPVAPGARGVLYIGGQPVARGYVRSAALTADRFRPDPYARSAGARMYATGDLARRREDGALVYLGRIDTQVKIAGNRVEIGEIEAALRQNPDVEQAAVTLDRDRQQLVAYVVAQAGKTPTVAALSAGLSQSLPQYMVPSRFLLLERLPLTANGKLDRAALPRPMWNDPEPPALPSTRLEEMLARIWGDVLGRAGIGTHDNFFEVGGGSLHAAQIIARASAELDVQLPLALLFQGEPTIARLAARIDAYLAAAGVLPDAEAAATHARRGGLASQVTI